MREAINRSLPGTRLQGRRHGEPRRTVPIKNERDIPKFPCFGPGRPEYPVEDIYAGRERQDPQKEQEEQERDAQMRIQEDRW